MFQYLFAGRQSILRAVTANHPMDYYQPSNSQCSECNQGYTIEMHLTTIIFYADQYITIQIGTDDIIITTAIDSKSIGSLLPENNLDRFEKNINIQQYRPTLDVFVI
jgi:hypothetical protein